MVAAEVEKKFERVKVPYVEKSMVWTAIGTFFLLLAVEGIAYLVLFKEIPGFLQNYGFYLLFLILGIVVNGIAVWHVNAYQRVMPCMTGMMIGMTIGMTTGLSLGMTLGATNGLFFGGVSALIIGMIVGAWVGKCCGVMGVMEGMMAGLMGGTMGPMISLMSLQYAKWMLGIIHVALILILIGLMVMMYHEEKVLEEKTVYRGYGFVRFAFWAILVTLILTFIMVYAPKSLLIG